MSTVVKHLNDKSLLPKHRHHLHMWESRLKSYVW